MVKEKKVQLTAAIPTGVNLKYIALAAEQEREQGKNNITPYWRVLRLDGSINAKFPLAVEELEELLIQEGHQLVPGKGKKTAKVIGL